MTINCIFFLIARANRLQLPFILDTNSESLFVAASLLRLTIVTRAVHLFSLLQQPTHDFHSSREDRISHGRVV